MLNLLLGKDLPNRPGRTRTCDPLLRRQMLYPAELRAREVSKFNMLGRTSFSPRLRYGKCWGTPVVSGGAMKKIAQMMTFIAVIALVVPVFADTLVLKNGERITGYYEGGTARVIKFRAADGAIKDYDLLSIQEIQFGEDKTASAPRPTPTSAPAPALTPAPAAVAAPAPAAAP